eukprot:snap_masked-scaffold_36-processed-gene-2.99-mRNA-1 protein AED:0.10 eAED:1.00 QI:0/-1/0/1/-1/1/1/0/240
MSTENKTVFAWPPLESNPESFNAYMHSIGIPSKFKFHEAIVLDPVVLCGDALYPLPTPVHACVAAIDRLKPTDSGDPQVAASLPFYMKQNGTLDNACGIIAILHSLLNINNVTSNIKTEEGDEKLTVIEELWKKVKNLNPEQRAREVEKYERLKTVHHEVAAGGQSAMPTTQAGVEVHYVAFVKTDQGIFELDGRKDGPVSFGQGDLVTVSAAEIHRRVQEGYIGQRLNVMFLSEEEEQV